MPQLHSSIPAPHGDKTGRTQGDYLLYISGWYHYLFINLVATFSGHSSCELQDWLWTSLIAGFWDTLCTKQGSQWTQKRTILWGISLPTNLKVIQCFLGMCLYRHFVPRILEIVKLPNALKCKGTDDSRMSKNFQPATKIHLCCEILERKYNIMPNAIRGTMQCYWWWWPVVMDLQLLPPFCQSGRNWKGAFHLKRPCFCKAPH